MTELSPTVSTNRSSILKSAERISRFGANTTSRSQKEIVTTSLTSSELIGEISALRKITSEFTYGLKHLESLYFAIQGKSAFDPCQDYCKILKQRTEMFFSDIKFSWVQNFVLGLYSELEEIIKSQLDSQNQITPEGPEEL